MIADLDFLLSKLLLYPFQQKSEKGWRCMKRLIARVSPVLATFIAMTPV